MRLYFISLTFKKKGKPGPQGRGEKGSQGVIGNVGQPGPPGLPVRYLFEIHILISHVR